jgi:5-formyltetrahydrofolate cyclo-ligase
MSRAPLRTQRTSHQDQNQRNRSQKLHADILRSIQTRNPARRARFHPAPSGTIQSQ